MIKSDSKTHVSHLELLPKMRMPETRSQGTLELPPRHGQAQDPGGAEGVWRGLENSAPGSLSSQHTSDFNSGTV